MTTPRNPGDLLQSDFDAGVARTDTTSPDDFDEVDDYYFKAGLEFVFLSQHLFKLETSFRNRKKKSFGTFSGGYFDADTQTDIYTLSPQLVLKQDAGLFSNRITVGADYSKSEQDYDSYSEYFGFPSQIEATLEKESRAYFFHDELGIGKHLSVSGGYRVDRAVFTYKPASPSEKTLDEEGFTLGGNYAFNEKSHVYVSYTRSFRYPVLDEQFSYFTNTVDTAIDAQTSDNVEIGVSAEITSGFDATLNLFRTETDNEIFYNPSSYANENMEGTAIRQGAELTLAWKNETTAVSGTYTRTAAEFDGGSFDGKEVPFVPGQQATVKISHTLGWGLTLGMDAVYVGESYLISDFQNNFDQADAYTVVNAKVKYDWHGYTFFVDLNNLFNEEYNAYSAVGYNSATFSNEPGYYPSPEFNFLLGVTARFGAR